MQTITTAERIAAALPDLTAEETALVPTVLAAVTRLFERYCDRALIRRPAADGSTNPVECAFEARPGRPALLPQYPINDVVRIECDPTVAITITNTSTAVQIADVRLRRTGDETVGQSADGITLASWSSAVKSETTITYSNAPTIAALATAVNAIGNGWSAQANPDLAQWPTAWIPTQTTKADAKTGAALTLWTTQPAYQLRPNEGIITIDDEGPGNDYRWPGSQDLPTGFKLYRALLDVGADPCPEDLQALAIDQTQTMFDRWRADSMVLKEKTKDLEWVFREGRDCMPRSVIEGLYPHKRKI